MNKNEVFYHTSTVNIVILEKNKKLDKDKRYYQYSVKVKNLYEPFQQYMVRIKDQDLWNLINKNEDYFVSVSWETNSMRADINGQVTTLEQIEPLDKVE